MRVLRIIARLNIGGPAIQAITLTKLLEPRGYTTTLVRGSEEPAEGSMDHLADELGVRPVLVPSLRRNPGWHDLLAVLTLVRIIRRERPQIVHTHAAKGGTLGRVATVIAFPRRRDRPRLVHTYHGHSLTGYFKPRTAAVYRWIERLLAGFTDRLIAVSTEVGAELVEMGIAPSSKFQVVRLGFDLSPFALQDPARQHAREALRTDLGIGSQTRVVTLIARLVPIKRVDRFLQVAQLLSDLPDVKFLVVGDGELRGELQASPAARALGDQLLWTGFRRDMPAVCFASDVVLLTSDNEGTPVSLIEAQAAAVPVVGTDVGGVRSAVRHGQTGLLVGAADVDGLAAGAGAILQDPEQGRRMGAAGREHAQHRFSVARLVDEHDRLYRHLLLPVSSPGASLPAKGAGLGRGRRRQRR